MRKSALVALVVALAACGGDDKSDPASRTFQYGAPAAPTDSQRYAAQEGEDSTAAGAALQADAAADPATAGSSIMSLPDRMAAEAWSSSTLALQASGLGRTLATLGGPTAATMAGFDNGDQCVVIAPGVVTYSACVVTIDTLRIQIDGRITRTGPTLAWDLATRMTDASPDLSMTLAVDATGALTFGAAEVTGRARSDTRGSFSGSGVGMRAAYTTLADLDLDFARDPFCVTGGTLELRRVWTERPAGAPADGQYADQGLLFSWQGCGTVLVAQSR